MTPDVLKKTKVVDLGADFRLKDLNIYEQWYQVEHHGQAVMNEAVYGLAELHREAIKQARLIGNPGCYTTCSILTLAPLVQAGIIDVDSMLAAEVGALGVQCGLLSIYVKIRYFSGCKGKNTRPVGFLQKQPF